MMGANEELPANSRPRMAWYKIYLIIVILVIIITFVLQYVGDYLYSREAYSLSQTSGGNLSDTYSLVAETILAYLPSTSNVLLISFLLGIYLFPFFVADNKNHRDRLLILGINIAFGWTVIGYLGVLVWSITPSRGVRTLAGEFAEKSVPILKEAADHNLTRGFFRSAQKASGGRFYNYKVPPEGIEHLAFDAIATRDYEGRLNLRVNTMLPPSTKLTLILFCSASREQVYLAEKEISSDGSVSASGLLNAGRVFDSGAYVLEVTSLPIEPSIQKDWIVDVLGEHGKNLPFSATIPVDNEFPNYGRRVHERLIVSIPGIQQHVPPLEILKCFTFSEGPKSRTVETVIRDHFSARLNERPISPTPWSCEQIGSRIWMINFTFKRQGRLSVARWEVDMQSGIVKYQDPDARALSGIERRS